MTTVTLHAGDNRESLRRLIAEGVRVHSVVTDPPYGLVSVTKRFGGNVAAPAKFGTDGAFQRQSRGFMGSKWDGTGIERDPEFWQLIHDILLPGGYCMAFSSPRTGHWQACAMENAGFIMHPFFGWTYGSGFPKAHNAAKAIDKRLGTPGSINPTGAPVKRMISGNQQHVTGDWTKTDAREYQPGSYVPGSDDAAQWEGWAYGAQSMKPALEPIYVGQKPFSEKNGVLNLLKHGVGAMNIDGCRVPGGEARPLIQSDRRSGNNTYSDGLQGSKAMGETTLGRHPANLLHDGSDEVVAMFPDSRGQIAKASASPDTRKNQHVYGDMARESNGAEPRNDTGSAGRFFNSFPLTAEDYELAVEFGLVEPLDADPIHYQSKANKVDRDGSKHPTVKPIALMRWLCRLVTPPGGTVLDPFGGSGTTGAAAQVEGFECILMEAEPEFISDIRRRFGLRTSSQFDDILGCDNQQSRFDDILG